MTRVDFRDVSAGYSGTPVVQDIALTVEPGTLLALLGPSGCGKTTLLRVAAGLLAPYSGEVLFDNQPVTAVPSERRRVAMVFQKPLLFPHLTVGGNVAFGLRMQNLDQAAIDRRVAEGLAMVQMAGFEKRKPGELSGGQEQRVSIARAIVTAPRLLLLDEPFSALDHSLRLEMRSLVRELQRTAGLTTIFVTHDQSEAAQLADRIALLLDGRIRQVGPARDFYEHPQSSEIARFFGWQLLHTEAAHTVWCRPEHICLANAGEFAGTVHDVIDAGTHLILRIATEQGTSIEAHASLRDLVLAGSTVRFTAQRTVQFHRY